MRAYLAIAPAWFWVMFQGVVFAAWMTVSYMVTDHINWQKALIEGAGIATVYGLVVWSGTRREREASAAILARMTVEQRREVLRATHKGTPPDDPTLRFAAAAMVRKRLSEHDRNRRFTLVVIAVSLVLSIVMTITDQFWWYLALSALFAWALVWTIRYPSQLHRKLAALGPGAPPARPPGKTRPR